MRHVPPLRPSLFARHISETIGRAAGDGSVIDIGAVTLYGTYLVNQAFRKSREKSVVSDEQGSHPAS